LKGCLSFVTSFFNLILPSREDVLECTSGVSRYESQSRSETHPETVCDIMQTAGLRQAQHRVRAEHQKAIKVTGFK
jgi:hypothetical protein